MTRAIPGNTAPDLKIRLVGGGEWSAGAASDNDYVLIDFYRGLHCPICSKHLGQLEAMAGDFAEQGVRLLAVSMDDEERAARAKADWGLSRVEVGYGMTEAQAKAWGLYMSDSIRDTEPRRFNEPGTFLIDGDGAIYMGAISTAPFMRPGLDRVLMAVNRARDGYPPRGTG